MSVVMCAGWVRHPLFKHLGRLLGRAFEGWGFVWAWLVSTWLLRLGALEGVHVSVMCGVAVVLSPGCPSSPSRA